MPSPTPADPSPKTLSEALSALQAHLPRVAKENTAKVESQTGRGYSYKYADLTDVTEAIMPLMAQLGLSFVACPTIWTDRFVLAYQLLHTGGESISGWYPLPSSGASQEIGKAVTYARRYALCAVTGLAPGGDDDDAAANLRADGLPVNRDGSLSRSQTSDDEKATAGVMTAGQAKEHPGPEIVVGSSNGKQHQQLGILYAKLGITERDTRLADMTDRVGREIGSAKDLSYAEAEQAIRAMRELVHVEGE